VASSSSSTPKQVYVVTKPTVERWHSRLGHPSSLVVQQVLNIFCLPYSKSSSIETVCDSCQKAKSHQLAYPVSTSVGRHNYYVSFIDDYSKFTWIYLIKKKSDVFDVFHNFMNFVERKFSRKIITMQTDWGGEYEKLNPFFQKLGITHHVSCPHAHQQNGSAERKHRHIVEVGLALLANASMPLKFWDEAFLTATYLINLVPSKVINNTSPVECLLETKPDYKSLRVFGCACWPNLRPYNSRKLAFRSKQYVFLGYSPRHKGVKCLEISTGRVYISRDVVFDENVFPFASLHPNAGALLRKELLLLPNHLVSSHGGPNNDDHMPNNCSPMPAVSSLQIIGENSEEIDANSSQNSAETGSYHMPEADESGADPDDDLLHRSGADSGADHSPTASSAGPTEESSSTASPHHSATATSPASVHRTGPP
jgi:histone deacetylase 1/2